MNKLHTIKNRKNEKTEPEEWVVFLNGKLFYIAQSLSIKDSESGKTFFESIIPSMNNISPAELTAANITSLTESPIH